ncbi:MAG: GNAT family N-acetyltransferase [Flavobacteriia bacterium]|nr:GNAT family N-acetyltransferase [Flavobacteriia bacterium]
MIVANAQLDKQRWDQRVLAEQPEGFFFMLSWYLDSVAPGWEGYVLGDYEGIYPIVRKQKFGVSFTHMPFLTRIFFPIGFNNKQTLDLQQYLSNRFSYLQLAGVSLNEPYEQQIRRYQVLDLASFDRSQCSENHRRQYKKAAQQRFKMDTSVNPAGLITLFRQVKGAEFTHLKDADYLLLARLMEEANRRGCLRQFSLWKLGELVGAAAYLEVNGQALYLKGAITQEAMKAGGMVYLHVEAMMALAPTCAQIDFGGSNAKGLGEFNRKFGARDVEYLLLIKNSLVKPLAWLAKRKFG